MHEGCNKLSEFFFLHHLTWKIYEIRLIWFIVFWCQIQCFYTAFCFYVIICHIGCKFLIKIYYIFFSTSVFYTSPGELKKLITELLWSSKFCLVLFYIIIWAAQKDVLCLLNATIISCLIVLVKLRNLTELVCSKIRTCTKTKRWSFRTIYLCDLLHNLGGFQGDSFLEFLFF